MATGMVTMVGMIMDPEVVSKLLARRSSQMPVTRLTDGECEVLALIAEGRSNSAIARRLVISEKAVSKHCCGVPELVQSI